MFSFVRIIKEMKNILIAIIYLSFSIITKAQEKDSLTLEERVKALESKTNGNEASVERINKLKITGYIQAQYQVAQNDSISSFSGGDFPGGIDKRFRVRRGRIKFTYDGNLTKFVFQMDATEKGLGIRDAYIKVTEPWTQWFSLQAGVHDRPFGFEVGYSSSQFESPERGRMSQILFPDESDLGARLEINAPKTSPWNFLKLEAGFYNGTNPNSIDFDKYKDFIGRLSLIRTNKKETIKYSGGISYYSGGYRPGNNNLYTLQQLSSGDKGFLLTNTALTKGKREYWGADAQLSFDNPIGYTTIRAEYIAGKHASTATKVIVPVTQPSGDTYLRNFDGSYLYYIQALGKSKNSIVVKYEWFNPNTKVDQSGIGVAGTKTSVADIKFSTLGLGWMYRWDENVRFTLYYDIVKNASTQLNLGKPQVNYTGDVKDNVLTIRVQFKF